MSRIAPVPPGSDPAAATVEGRLIAARGAVSPLYQILMNSIEAADGWEYFLTIVRQRLSLSPRLREMLILRIAVLNRAPYEFDTHIPHARDAGISDAEIQNLRTGRMEGLAPLEQLIIAYTDAVTRDIHVSDDLFARVRQALSSRELVDLTVTIAAYNMVSRLLGAFDIK